MNPNRYLRQTALPEIGQTGQEKLKEAKVLCVGSGGLGSPALLYLAAAGVGKIGIIDPDTVSISNLQRQILFRTKDQGAKKTEIARETLLAINPEITIETYPESFTDRNALALLEGYDLVIDGSDNFATKFLINDAAYLASIPMVYGSVSSFEGQVAIFSARTGSCYRCFHPMPPTYGIRNCAESGVLGSVVGTIGTLQATLALQYLISKDDEDHPLRPRFGNLTLFDFAGSWANRSVQIPKQSMCPTCSRHPHEVRLQYSPETCEQVETLSPDELRRLLDSRSAPLLIDVREEDEWAMGHLPGSLHWPLSVLEQSPSTLGLDIERERDIVLYCAAGVRSAKAARLLKQYHSLKCKSLIGGIREWTGALIRPS